MHGFADEAVEETDSGEFEFGKASEFVLVDPFGGLVDEHGQGVEHVVVGDSVLPDIMTVQVVEASEGGG